MFLLIFSFPPSLHFSSLFSCLVRSVSFLLFFSSISHFVDHPLFFPSVPIHPHIFIFIFFKDSYFLKFSTTHVVTSLLFIFLFLLHLPGPIFQYPAGIAGHVCTK